MQANICFLLLVLIFTESCNKIRRNDTEFANENPNENCVQFSNSHWIDEDTWWDLEDKDLDSLENGYSLKSLLKNICSDTIQIPITDFGLDVGIVLFYLNNDESGGYRREEIVRSRYLLAPSDSFYVQVTEARYKNIIKVDSITVPFRYLIKNKELWGSVVLKKEMLSISSK